MISGVARSCARGVLGGLMRARTRSCGPEELAGDAVVFAPHPDDETLGCGGTIALKRRHGAGVEIVVLTDGSSSHGRLMDGGKIRSIREEEAREAAGVLGVGAESVAFLRFPDQGLGISTEEATKAVEEVLKAKEFDQVFVPYFREPVADHAAANRIVLAALGRTGREATVYEYPVWFWEHWPWVAESRREGGGMRNLLRRTLFQAPRMAVELQCSVDVSGVLDLKREALRRYRTQTTRYLPETDWPILDDVAGGTFLECFFRGREVFRRYAAGGREPRC